MLEKTKLVDLYTKMQHVRILEYAIKECHGKGQVRGPVHLCVGQEATGVGACDVLNEDDWVTSTHRGHAHFVGKGLELKRMVAEMMGKADGYCGGKASHMLIASREHGMLGGCGIVGGALGIGTGYGLAFRMQGSKRVALSFLGDGSANEGMFHEALNMATLWKTNTVFFAEHNWYGLTVRYNRHTPIENIADRAISYGIPGVIVDGNDILAVREVTREAVDRARRGDGPTLIEAKTYRILGFSTGDKGGYQSQSEIDEWENNNNPITRFAKYLTDNGVCTAAEIGALDAKAKADVDEAIQFGLNSPYPAPETVMEGIFARHAPPCHARTEIMGNPSDQIQERR